MKFKVLSIMLVVVICLSAVSVSATTGSWQSSGGPYGWYTTGTYEFLFLGNDGAYASITSNATLYPDEYLDTHAQVFYTQPGDPREYYAYQSDHLGYRDYGTTCSSHVYPPSGTTATWALGNVSYGSIYYGDFGKYWNSLQ